MELEKNNAENYNNMMDLYDEIHRLSEQTESIKEIMDVSYPMSDFSVIYQRIKGLEEEIKNHKDQYAGIKQYVVEVNNRLVSLDKKIQDDNKITQKKHYSKNAGLWPLLLVGIYSFLLLFFAIGVFFINKSTQIIITLIICGSSVLLIIAFLHLFFSKKT